MKKRFWLLLAVALLTCTACSGKKNKEIEKTPAKDSGTHDIFTEDLTPSKKEVEGGSFVYTVPANWMVLTDSNRLTMYVGPEAGTDPASILYWETEEEEWNTSEEALLAAFGTTTEAIAGDGSEDSDSAKYRVEVCEELKLGGFDAVHFVYSFDVSGITFRTEAYRARIGKTIATLSLTDSDMNAVGVFPWVEKFNEMVHAMTIETR